MADLKPNELLNIDKKYYGKLFKESDFGVMLATQVANDHGFSQVPIRKPEGSSLVFSLGSDYFLKLTPPFFEDSLEAEIAATKVIGEQLPFPIPKIVVNGDIKNWKYVITQTVPGQQAKDIFKIMEPTNKMTFASDIGYVIKAFNNIDSTGFERSFGPWDIYLANQLKNQRSIHLNRGNSTVWVDKICVFIETHAPALRKLSPAKLIHADLNHEHLMLTMINDIWRISGVIDLADAMNAPIELEFVLPIISFFKGRSEHQQLLLKEAGYSPQFKLSEYSDIMMALTLQNRFIAFHDWFDREIEKGAESIEDIASAIFPAL